MGSDLSWQLHARRPGPPPRTSSIIECGIPYWSPGPLVAGGFWLPPQAAYLVAAGMFQANVRLAASLPPGPAPVVVAIGGYTGQSGLTVAVR